jgi:hypothetical protein
VQARSLRAGADRRFVKTVVLRQKLRGAPGAPQLRSVFEDP